ncbi:hypothetical protein Tsubulata_033649 [Turnera subulata]|uniref:RING-type domain-containing protein n=1 Tax=Turnera subulata TaxID=218843 RepID=A0A9Q0G3Q2_9ROSI|nr:hypothetical protein Tsubulata_033649 [Turnera subulata]
MAKFSSSDSNSTYLRCLIDSSFDLDEALTLPESSPDQQITTANSLVAEMPTVLPDEDSICSICMEGFSPDIGGKRVSCGHVYHATCISSWLSRYDSCPLCRCDISGGR